LECRRRRSKDIQRGEARHEALILPRLQTSCNVPSCFHGRTNPRQLVVHCANLHPSGELPSLQPAGLDRGHPPPFAHPCGLSPPLNGHRRKGMRRGRKIPGHPCVRSISSEFRTGDCAAAPLTAAPPQAMPLSASSFFPDASFSPRPVDPTGERRMTRSIILNRLAASAAVVHPLGRCALRSSVWVTSPRSRFGSDSTLLVRPAKPYAREF